MLWNAYKPRDRGAQRQLATKHFINEIMINSNYQLKFRIMVLVLSINRSNDITIFNEIPIKRILIQLKKIGTVNSKIRSYC